MQFTHQSCPLIGNALSQPEAKWTDRKKHNGKIYTTKYDSFSTAIGPRTSSEHYESLQTNAEWTLRRWWRTWSGRDFQINQYQESNLYDCWIMGSSCWEWSVTFWCHSGIDLQIWGLGAKVFLGAPSPQTKGCGWLIDRSINVNWLVACSLMASCKPNSEQQI